MSCKEKKGRKIEKIRDLKVKNLCAQNIKSQNIESNNITSNNITTTDLRAENVILNGKSLNCILRNMNGEDFGSVLDPVDEEGKPIRNPNISEVVFNALLCNAQYELEGLRERLEEGRQDIRDFEIENNCPTCGNTGPVGMEIYGYITKPLLSLKTCGVTGGTGPNAYSEELQILNSLNYNLEVEYDIRETKSFQPRVVSVLCQMAFIDPGKVTGETGATGICSIPQGDCGYSVCGPVFLEELFFGNKQFTPTLDRLYGENFNGTVIINTELATLAAEAMPSINNCAAVQIVFFVEEGLGIWTTEESRGGGGGPCTKNCPVNISSNSYGAPNCSQGGLWPCLASAGPGEPTSTAGCATPITASFTVSADSGTSPLTVQFTDTSVFQVGGLATNPVYNWNFGDGGNSNIANPTHTYNQPGTYNVVLTMSYDPRTYVRCEGTSTSETTTITVTAA